MKHEKIFSHICKPMKNLKTLWLIARVNHPFAFEKTMKLENPINFYSEFSSSIYALIDVYVRFFVNYIPN